MKDTRKSQSEFFVPAALVDRDQWVLYDVDKVPHNANTGRAASSTDPATWVDFQTATRKATNGFAGIGYVFSVDDPFVGVDLDHCRDPETEAINLEATEIITELNSYTEISPSGTGVHIIIKAELPSGGRRRNGHFECYSEGRYFTVTGDHLAGTPTTIEPRQEQLDAAFRRIFPERKNNGNGRPKPRGGFSPFHVTDNEILEAAFAASNRDKVRRLWSGDTSDYPSQSEVDQALCNHLAFYTGNDPGRINELFQQSGLMREKWEREDYRNRTINSAIAVTTETWTPRSSRHHENSDRATSHGSNNHSAGVVNETSDPPDVGKIFDLLTQGHHDTGNADRIQLLHGDGLRYCEELRKYICYDGKKWTSDATGTAKKMAKETMLEFLRQAFDKEDPKAKGFARLSLNANRIKAALDLLQCEVPIRAADLDTNPWLLNFENGTYDLKVGELRDHRREDYITKIVPFPYNPDAKCERFLAFLHQTMGATEDSGLGELERAERLVRYLQKTFGYAITGDVSEKAVYCFFGPIDAGKTTLLETIRYPLAEYSHQILIDSLMVRHNQETNNTLADLADLKGARFVTTSEGEDGQRWAQAKLKYLSAGMGKIKTCRKYENPITFEATHKLFLDSNYKPVVKGDDDAVWNRLKPIPFTVSVPTDQIDRGLGEKLQAEAEGILAWLVEGCRRWQAEGLDQPEEVEAANQSWRSEMDPLPDFLADCCEIDPNAFCQVTTFRKAYEAWADENGDREFPYTT